MTLHDDTPTTVNRPVRQPVDALGMPVGGETIGDAEPALAGQPVARSRRVVVLRRFRLRPPGRPSRWTLAWTFVALVLAGAAGFVAWLGVGLLGASRDIKTSAYAGQDQLQLFKTAATAGDKATAASYLAAADANLAHARKRAQDPQVRVAAHLPVLSTPVGDLDHLLGAATTIAAAGHEGLDLYSSLAGGGASSIYSQGKFDIPALRALTTSATAIDAKMALAEADLTQVKGTGLKETGVLAAREKGLIQVRSLRKQMTDALPLLSVLPDAVGASGPRTYLVAVMNPAELRASGGAPLSVAELHFENGVMTRGRAGSTSELTAGTGTTVNIPIAWPHDPKDPFYQVSKNAPGKAPFVNAGFNPDFRVSGRNMAAAWGAEFGMKVDGVIALDTNAIAQVLNASGAIVTPGYGTVDATNLQDLLLKDAYSPALAGSRHTLNYELMGAFIDRLQSGGALVANAKGLAAAVPGRHLQLWFGEQRLEDLVAQKRYDGSVATPTSGDLIAVYTQNGNASKTDVFQQRSVSDSIVLNPDGSAKVTRTVTIKNTFAVTNPVQVQVHRDYLTGWMRPGVITLLPRGAVVTKEPVSTVKGSRAGVDQNGRPFYQSNLEIAPGASGTWVLEFTVPAMGVMSGNAMTVALHAEPQGMTNVQLLHVDVTAPAGWTVTQASGAGSSVAGGKGLLETPVDRARSATITLQRSGS